MAPRSRLAARQSPAGPAGRGNPQPAGPRVSDGLSGRRPLLLGEVRQDRLPGPALLGRSGRQLATALGMDPDAYAVAFRRRNLLATWPGGDRWPTALAVATAQRMTLCGVVILLGRRVAHAFGLVALPPLAWVPLGDATLAVLPHPSGLNRSWNDRAHVLAAGALLRDALAAAKLGKRAARTMLLAEPRRVS